jgi:membrane protease YdiL (CAAX protease family)
MTISESPVAPTSPATAAPPPLPGSPKPPRIWKFWATLAWSLLLYIAMTAAAAVGIVAAVNWYGIDISVVGADKAAFLNDGVVVAATSLSGTLPVLAVIWLAVKLARQKFADYLALRLPSMRQACIGLGAIVLLMFVIDATSKLVGRPVVPQVLIDGVRSAGDHRALGFFTLALVVTAPITEEIAFRGFIYRGFAASRLGTVGAVILSSLIFAAIHVQYDPITLAGVLATALLLGTMRAIGGSTLLTIAMHALNNFVVLMEMLWFAGMLPR